MASSFTIFILLCAVSFALAVSIPIDGNPKDVLHYQPHQDPASPDVSDVKIRVKRQRNRYRNRGGGGASIQGLSRPFCDNFGCRNQRQSQRRRCGNGFRFDGRTGNCRRLRG